MTKQLDKQSIGVGVAGTGFIGPAHVEGLRRIGIQVLGLAEVSEERAYQKAAELGIPRAYGIAGGDAGRPGDRRGPPGNA